MIPYVAAGQKIFHGQLDALALELETIMDGLFAGKSPAIYGDIGDILYGSSRRFFFGTSGNWKIIPIAFPGAAAYNHSTYTSAAAGMTVTSYDGTLQLAYANDDPWPLDGSLEAHTRTSGSVAHYLSPPQGSGRMVHRERFRRVEPIDVFMEAVSGAYLAWSSDWNKYHFIRFHNLDLTSVQVALPGGQVITVPALSCISTRRDYPNGNTWEYPYKYVWKSKAGDTLFFDCEIRNNVASLLYYTRTIQDLSSTIDPISSAVIPRLGFDPLEVWDGEHLLPEAIDDSRKVRHYRHHAGRMISWTAASSGSPVPTDFTPTWSDIEAGTNGVKYNASTRQLEAQSGATTPVDLIGIGSNITPRKPVTLPFSMDVTAGGWQAYEYSVLKAIAIVRSSHSLSATYNNAGTPVTITGTALDWGTSTYESTPTANLESTISSLKTLTLVGSFYATASLESYTIDTKSDGSRVVVGSDFTFVSDYPVTLPTSYSMQCSVSGGVITHRWGGNVTGREYSPLLPDSEIKFLSRLSPEQQSSFVGGHDAFGVVYYDGHPDFTGHYGLAGGIDWEGPDVVSSGRSFVRDDVLPPSVVTNTCPVIPVADSSESIAANATSGSWYASNRTNLLAGNTTVAERETLIRVPVNAAHYNSVAQRLNSVRSINPHTFDQLIYYGGWYNDGIADDTWTLSVYPSRYYCPAKKTGTSRAVDLGLSVSTIESTHKYVSLNAARDYASTLGVRFFARRIVGFRRKVSGEFVKTNSTSDIYRVYSADNKQLINCTEHAVTTDGYYVGPPSTGQVPGYEIEDPFEVEHSQETGTIQSGWAIAGDDTVYREHLEGVTYDDMTPAVDLAHIGDAVLFAQSPRSTPNRSSHPASTFDNSPQTSSSLSSLTSPTEWTDASCVVKVLSRFFIIRS